MSAVRLHLRGNPNTDYKKRVLETLEDALGSYGTMAVKDGPAKGTFDLVFSEQDFPRVMERVHARSNS